jgi:hypothetical protein
MGYGFSRNLVPLLLPQAPNASQSTKSLNPQQRRAEKETPAGASPGFLLMKGESDNHGTIAPEVLATAVAPFLPPATRQLGLVEGDDPKPIR